MESAREIALVPRSGLRPALAILVALLLAPAGSGEGKKADAKALWSLQPVRAVRPPGVKGGAWPRDELDHYILAALEAKGLSPAPPADRRTLIRRATFDLIGLPPTPA